MNNVDIFINNIEQDGLRELFEILKEAKYAYKFERSDFLHMIATEMNNEGLSIDDQKFVIDVLKYLMERLHY